MSMTDHEAHSMRVVEALRAEVVDAAALATVYMGPERTLTDTEREEAPAKLRRAAETFANLANLIEKD
ncbi:hypothetical protein [Microbacterium sp. LWH13-1.2]|uniref:hypothetical protein n=1 Tax=Microbacterium sp. LWH13-1.2 TaxID=3135260 RepID=UPI003139DA78